MSQDFQEKEIAALAARIVELVAPEEADPLIKAAALRVAAEVMSQAVSTQALLAAMYKAMR